MISNASQFGQRRRHSTGFRPYRANRLARTADSIFEILRREDALRDCWLSLLRSRGRGLNFISRRSSPSSRKSRSERRFVRTDHLRDLLLKEPE